MALGEVTNPGGTEKLHEYWVHGEGAAKIAWGTPGDFDRCVRHLGKYIRDPKGYCAKAHHDALGVWPGQEHGGKKGRSMDAERAPSNKPYGNETYADPKNGKYPLTKGGKFDSGRIHAAWSYINQADNAAEYPLNGVTLSAVKGRIKAAAAKIGMKINSNSADPAGEERTLTLPEPFEVRDDGDGLTFEGYAIVYNQIARIAALDDDFDERVAPGAPSELLSGRFPVFMFEHGRHPLLGTMPLGPLTGAYEDSRGTRVRGRLTDNWLIQPVRDAVRDGAITGMSIRFTVNDGGETWESRSGDVDLRTLTSISVAELGPVVFPAYELTTASVRSALDSLPVIGRPTAGARAAIDRADSPPGNGVLSPPPTARFRADGEALALRGIKGVKIDV